MKNQIDRNVAEIMTDEMGMRDRIISQLSEDPKTIPEIAKALDFSSYDVMLWVMTMWRYGALEEVGKANADGYFKYRPVE